MRVEVSIAEASGELCQVPVCIGCHRPASGAGTKRLSTVDAVPPGAGSGDGVAGLIGIMILGAGVLTWAASNKVVVRYPACWWHRWCFSPLLRLVAAARDRVVLEGVSAEFLAGWQSVCSRGAPVRGTPDTGPGASPDRQMG